jgi:hypothetical protein
MCPEELTLATWMHPPNNCSRRRCLGELSSKGWGWVWMHRMNLHLGNARSLVSMTMVLTTMTL